MTWGRLSPALAEALLPAFVSAVERRSEFSDQRHRYIEFYTALAVFHMDNPRQKVLPVLFQHGAVDDRISFASYVCHFLRQMQPDTKQELWNRWLFRYWQDRQQGIPVSLEDGEIREMLGWLPHLDTLFPAAVSLAVQSKTIRIEHSHLLYI